MAWQKFDRRSASRTTRPTITVQRRGTISLSGPAVKLLVGSDNYPDKINVELLYDPERQLIGITQADPENPNPHILRRQGTSEVYLVSGTLFCAHYGIDTRVARRYHAKKHEDILGIKLTDSHAIVGRKKRGDEDDREGDSRGDSSSQDDLEKNGDGNPAEEIGESEDSEKPDPWSG